MLSVEIVFILILLISLPNLFYRAQFNVPLLLFAAISWNHRKSTSVYLFVVSLFMEVYRVITLVAYDSPALKNQKQPYLVIITIVAFVFKIILLVYLTIKDEQVRNSLKPSNIITNICSSIKGTQQSKQV